MIHKTYIQQRGGLHHVMQGKICIARFACYVDAARKMEKLERLEKLAYLGRLKAKHLRRVK